VASRLRLLSGLETADLNEWNSTTFGAANWSIQAAAGSKRSTGGAYGLEVIRTAPGSNNGGGYVTQEFGTDNSKFNQFANLVGSQTTLTLPISFRFYLRINTYSVSNVVDLLRFTITGGRAGATDATFAVTLSGTNRTLFANADNGLLSVMNLSTATWYRIEGTLIASGTSVATTVSVYTETGTTPTTSSISSAITALGVSLGVDKVNWGVRPLSGNTQVAYDIDFDDLRINDQDSSLPGPGAMLAIRHADADNTMQWGNGAGGASGTSTEANIDDWVSDAEFNECPAAGSSLEDLIDMAVYGGSNDVTGVLVLHRSADVVGVTGGNTYIGLSISGTRYEAPAFLSDNGTGAKIYRGVCVDWQGKTDTDYDNALLTYRRSGGGGFQKDIYSVAILIEDNDAGTAPADPTQLRSRGGIF
jgi:hypothetical protein